jgi:hypothetical protein
MTSEVCGLEQGHHLAKERYELWGKTAERARALADATSMLATVGLARQERAFAARTVQDALVIAAKTIDDVPSQNLPSVAQTLEEAPPQDGARADPGTPGQSPLTEGTSQAGSGMERTDWIAGLTTPPMQTYQQCGSERYLQVRRVPWFEP